MNSYQNSKNFQERLSATALSWSRLPREVQHDCIEKLRDKDPRLAHMVSRNLFPISNLTEAVTAAVFPLKFDEKVAASLMPILKTLAQGGSHANE